MMLRSLTDETDSVLYWLVFRPVTITLLPPLAMKGSHSLRLQGTTEPQRCPSVFKIIIDAE